MNIKKVHIFYFSPTQTTKTVVENIGKGIDLETHIYDFTFSCDSPKDYNFGKDDLIIVGVPVYGGRGRHQADLLRYAGGIHEGELYQRELKRDCMGKSEDFREVHTDHLSRGERSLCGKRCQHVLTGAEI